MDSEGKKVCKIDDERLAGYEKRTRSGSTQVFYTGDDERDFDRYRAEGGGRSHNVEMHDKPDTIRIQPPEKHYYAQPIDGEWWWVNGCPECNGNTPKWAYVKCERHDVCVSCGTSREKLTETPRCHEQGFQCKPCADADQEAAKTEALAKVATEEYDEWDYHHCDKVTCPHCASSYEPDEPPSDGEETCEVCGGEFSLEVEYSVSYTSRVVGERVTA